MAILRFIFPLLLGGIFCIFTLPGVATAQINDSFGAQLNTEPLYPKPLSPVTVNLEAYSFDTTGATILWYIDGVEQVENRNERALTFTTGKIGERDTVLAKITPQNSFTVSTSLVVTPSEVDIILEAETYVPAFYKGRTLPAGNSVVRAIAIPHMVPAIPLSSLTYEWRQGETVLFGGPVKGKYAADITVSRYEGDYIQVTVAGERGEKVGGRAISLTPAEPELHFYEENPLRGLSTKAIKDSLMLIGDETTIHAEPFFMTTDLSTDTARFEWRVDGGIVTTDVENGHTLTVRKTGTGGSGRIETTALTTTAIPQYVQDGFTIQF